MKYMTGFFVCFVLIGIAGGIGACAESKGESRGFYVNSVGNKGIHQVLEDKTKTFDPILGSFPSYREARDLADELNSRPPWSGTRTIPVVADSTYFPVRNDGESKIFITFDGKEHGPYIIYPGMTRWFSIDSHCGETEIK